MQPQDIPAQISSLNMNKDLLLDLAKNIKNQTKNVLKLHEALHDLILLNNTCVKDAAVYQITKQLHKQSQELNKANKANIVILTELIKEYKNTPIE